jgi:hypothetical protein
MAARKSASRKSAAKKALKTRKSRPPAKKAAKAAKQRAAGKKVAATRKRPAAAKKAQAPRKAKAPAVTQAKTTAVTRTAPPKAPMPDVSSAVADIDNRIAIVRSNLRELVEQATSYSGASDEERLSQRISEQETKLEALRKQRRELAGEE